MPNWCGACELLNKFGACWINTEMLFNCLLSIESRSRKLNGDLVW